MSQNHIFFTIYQTTKMKNYFYLLFVFTLASFSCKNERKESTNTISIKTPTEKTDYERRWASFKTKLVRHEKAPQIGERLKNNGTIKVVTYKSNGLELQALLETKNIDPHKRKPVLVFLHGGFSLGMGDIEDCQIFTDNNFIVFSPSYRGENQNGGNYELLLGEVADAKEAIRWIASQPYVDTAQIYTFGHSIGGGISLNLSLHSDIPIRMGGSSAGLYHVFPVASPPFIDTAEKDILKDNNINPETELRLAFYHLNELQRIHYMYIGNEDGFEQYKQLINVQYQSLPSKFNLIQIEGNHFSSLQPAFKRYLEAVKNEMLKR